MAINGINPAGVHPGLSQVGGVSSVEQGFAGQRFGQMPDFEKILQKVEAQAAALRSQLGADGVQGVDAAKAAQKTGAVDGVVGVPGAATVDRPIDVGPAEKIISQAEEQYARLNELLGVLDSKDTFTPKELLRIQGEMHQITLNFEAWTRLMGESVSSVKNVLQQQI